MLKPREENGFTLIEVLITLVIVSIGLLGTAKMLMVSIKTNSDNERRMDSSAVVGVLLLEAATRVSSTASCTAITQNGRCKNHQ